MKIMVGYRSFDAEGQLEKAALNHASAFNAKLYLVGSMEIGEDIPKEKFDKAEKNLEQGKSFFTEQGIDCETVLIETSLTAGENIVEFAREKRVDEIIMGVQNRSKLGKLIFGSTAQYVVLNSSCPVLCVSEEKNQGK